MDDRELGEPSIFSATTEHQRFHRKRSKKPGFGEVLHGFLEEYRTGVKEPMVLGWARPKSGDKPKIEYRVFERSQRSHVEGKTKKDSKKKAPPTTRTNSTLGSEPMTPRRHVSERIYRNETNELPKPYNDRPNQEDAGVSESDSENLHNHVPYSTAAENLRNQTQHPVAQQRRVVPSAATSHRSRARPRHELSHNERPIRERSRHSRHDSVGYLDNGQSEIPDFQGTEDHKIDTNPSLDSRSRTQTGPHHQNVLVFDELSPPPSSPLLNIPPNERSNERSPSRGRRVRNPDLQYAQSRCRQEHESLYRPLSPIPVESPPFEPHDVKPVSPVLSLEEIKVNEDGLHNLVIEDRQHSSMSGQQSLHEKSRNPSKAPTIRTPESLHGSRSQSKDPSMKISQSLHSSRDPSKTPSTRIPQSSHISRNSSKAPSIRTSSQMPS